MMHASTAIFSRLNKRTNLFCSVKEKINDLCKKFTFSTSVLVNQDIDYRYMQAIPPGMVCMLYSVESLDTRLTVQYMFDSRLYIMF